MESQMSDKSGFNFKKWANDNHMMIKTAGDDEDGEGGDDIFGLGNTAPDFDAMPSSAPKVNDNKLLAICTSMVDTAAMDFGTAKSVYLKASELLGENMDVARQMIEQSQDIVTSHTYSLLQKMDTAQLRLFHDFLKTVQ